MGKWGKVWSGDCECRLRQARARGCCRCGDGCDLRLGEAVGAGLSARRRGIAVAGS
jgi:hypothetical protein